MKQLLVEAGEKLPFELRGSIVAQGKGVVPTLIDILDNELLQQEDAPGGGLHPASLTDVDVKTTTGQASCYKLPSLPPFKAGQLHRILEGLLPARRVT